MHQHIKKIFLGTVILLGLYLFSFIFLWKVEHIKVPEYNVWKKNQKNSIILKKVIDPSLQHLMGQWKKASYSFFSPQLLEWKKNLQMQFWVKNVYVSRELPNTWILSIRLFQPQYHLVYENLMPLIDKNNPTTTQFIGDEEELKQLVTEKYQQQHDLSLYFLFKINISDFSKIPNPLLLKKLLDFQKLCEQNLSSNIRITQLDYNKIGFLTATAEITHTKIKKIKIHLGFFSENKLLQQPKKLSFLLKKIDEQLLKTPFTQIPEYIKLIQ